MWINRKDKKLTITFDYDPKIVAAIRSISGRKFNAKYKRWEVPVYSTKETLDILKPLGFNMHIDVLEALKQEEEFIEKIDAIRKTPEEYTGSLPLYDFQKIGAGFSREMDGSLLAFQPGLGKTLTSIAACDNLKEGKILVICPKTLLHSWEEEIYKWLPLSNVIIVEGTKKDRLKIYERAKSERKWYMLINYEMVLYDNKELQEMSKEI